MKLIYKIETMNSNFTQFASCLLTSVNKETEQDHITIITPDYQNTHFPKIWVLNVSTDSIFLEKTLEIKPNQSDAVDKYKFKDVAKKEI